MSSADAKEESQPRSQMRRRWGPHGTTHISNNSAKAGCYNFDICYGYEVQSKERTNVNGTGLFLICCDWHLPHKHCRIHSAVWSHDSVIKRGCVSEFARSVSLGFTTSTRCLNNALLIRKMASWLNSTVLTALEILQEQRSGYKRLRAIIRPGNKAEVAFYLLSDIVTKHR